jgi:hypothetical protein
MGSSGIFLQSRSPDTDRAHLDTLSKSLKELKSNDQATCDANNDIEIKMYFIIIPNRLKKGGAALSN